MNCSAGFAVEELHRAIGQPSKAYHYSGSVCIHRIYAENGDLIYDGWIHRKEACRFARMQVDFLSEPRRYRGECQCGHLELWTTDKDEAWQEIASHFLPLFGR